MPNDPRLEQAGFDGGVVEYIVDGTLEDGRFKTPGDDLDPDIRKKLGTYLSQRSIEGHDSGPGPTRGNRFVIGPNPTTLSIRDENGNPSGLDSIAEGSTNPYSPTIKTPSLQPGMRTSSSDSTLFTLGEFLKKGKADRLLVSVAGTDGGLRTHGEVVSPPPRTVVLNGQQIPIESDEPASRMRAQISRVLTQNRFNPKDDSGDDSPFDVRGERQKAPLDEQEDFDIAGIQRQLGIYDPNGTGINFTDLKDVGDTLMRHAVGDDIEGNTNGLSQLGNMIEQGSLSVIRDNLTPSVSGRFDTFERGTDSPASFGSFYRDVDRFLSNDKTSKALAGALLLILNKKISREIDSEILDRIDTVMANERIERDRQDIPIVGSLPGGDLSYKLGRSTLQIIRTPEFRQTLDELGLYIPRNKIIGMRYKDVINRGIVVLFGRDENSNQISTQNNYYTTLIRGIIRDTVINKDLVSNISSQSSVISNTMYISNRPIVRMINILAQIGDISLMQDEKRAIILGSSDVSIGDDAKMKIGIRDNTGWGIVDKNGILIGVSDRSLIDSLPEFDPVSRAGKSRMSDGGLSMGASRTPSRFLLPANVIGAVAILSSIQGAKGPASFFNQKNAMIPGVDRLPKAVVTEVEAELNAEYVPFYFHDLRTNEIVSFNAFISSLSDSISADYNSVKAYGRIDDVHNYRSTKRSLNFSFYVAATSKSDFDMMWFKVNKLTTLCYPQWSKGEEIQQEVERFTQPFSQIPTATPVIRLRIGDVIRSNMSKFNLYRIFGFGDGISGDPISFFNPETNAIVKSFESVEGQGLAGILRNINTDFVSDDITWETSYIGSRAPKLLKLTCAFDVIHDIAPGIDSHGFNRAPIYNVGAIMNSVAGFGGVNDIINNLPGATSTGRVDEVAFSAYGSRSNRNRTIKVG